jgi:copper(I)-binding protein
MAVLALCLATAVNGAGVVSAHDEATDPSPAAMAPMATPPSMPSMPPMPTMGPGVLVHDAWTRASPMMDLAGAAYMVIDNTTTEDDALVRASSPAAEIAEIHQTTTAPDGTLAMAPVEAIPVPAGGRAVLEPGGYHIMLIGLVEPLVEGGAIEVTLEFEHASPRTVSALVQPVGPMGAAPAGSAPSEED